MQTVNVSEIVFFKLVALYGAVWVRVPYDYLKSGLFLYTVQRILAIRPPADMTVHSRM